MPERLIKLWNRSYVLQCPYMNSYVLPLPRNNQNQGSKCNARSENGLKSLGAIRFHQCS